MNTRTPKLSYILAVISGILAFFLIDKEIFPYPLVIAFFLGGSLFGFLWPRESWRWGFWIAGPVLAALALSVFFAGQPEVFIKKDLPVLFAVIAAACFGGFIFSKIKSRQKVRP